MERERSSLHRERQCSLQLSLTLRLTQDVVLRLSSQGTLLTAHHSCHRAGSHRTSRAKFGSVRQRKSKKSSKSLAPRWHTENKYSCKSRAPTTFGRATYCTSTSPLTSAHLTDDRGRPGPRIDAPIPPVCRPCIYNLVHAIAACSTAALRALPGVVSPRCALPINYSPPLTFGRPYSGA